MYKVVDGLVPAIPPNEFLKPAKQKHQAKVKRFENCDTKKQNILDRHTSKNNKNFTVEHCKTEQLKHSFSSSYLHTFYFHQNSSGVEPPRHSNSALRDN